MRRVFIVALVALLAACTPPAPPVQSYQPPGDFLVRGAPSPAPPAWLDYCRREWERDPTCR